MKKILSLIILLFIFINTTHSFSINTNISSQQQNRYINQVDSLSVNLDRKLESFSKYKKEELLNTVIQTIDFILNNQRLSSNNIFLLSYLKYDLENKIKPKNTYYKVSRVVDGDTIIVLKNGQEKRVRLIGIDTPETVHPSKPVECFGPESSVRANELLQGKKVRLESDDTQDQVDMYGRLLRYVFLEDGFFYNSYMIENGYAFEYTFRTAYKYQDKFKSLEQKAKENKVGFWSPYNCDGNLEIKEDISKEKEEKTNTGYSFYTSSHHSARLYYCETDLQWQGLSERNLRKFDSVEALLEAFPSRTLNDPCK